MSDIETEERPEAAAERPEAAAERPETAAPPATRREPVFNVPSIVLALLGALVAVHAVVYELLDFDAQLDALTRFAFVPAFYHVDAARLLEPLALFWSPVTHGFLHGSWTHLGVNAVWLVAFGTPVAKRFGTARFALFTLLGFAAGAAAHYVAYPYDQSPLVGASGGVSAFFGAATRFALLPGRMGSDRALRLPALTLRETLTTRSTMVFIVVWLAINWVAGSGIVPLDGEAQIAWEAHVGGFLFGLLLFPLFDRPRAVRSRHVRG